MALSHEGIGIVLTRKEQYPEALSHFEERYAISKSQGDQKSVGYSLMERADILWQLGRYGEARAALNQASALADQPGGNKALLAEIHQVSAKMAFSERRFPEAKAKSQQALDLAGTQYVEIAIQAKRVLGLAQALSGSPREGKLLCEEAVEMATRSRDPWLLSLAQLSLASAVLESGDAQGALTTALGAQASFARSGQQDSEWSAWLIAAHASRRAGDEAKAHEYASHAADLLNSLQQKWGTEAYSSYLTRPDVQYSRKQLGELLAGYQ
jgi:ATP/maltotriose-dependent transcriptional regulator MalT